jgi:hypothetical protein
VRGTSPRAAADEESATPCLLTNYTELYVNDKFSSFDAIQVGDRIELIGYHRADPPPERLVVSLAYITRPEPPPTPPDLAAAAAPRAPQEK